MHGSGVVFGERVVLLGDAPSRLPGPLLIPAGVIRPQDHHAPAGAAGAVGARGCTRRGGVLLPGSGPTVAERVGGAVDPTARRRGDDAAARLGVHLSVQDEVDIPAAERLCPAAVDEVRHAAAVLDLGVWRHRIRTCPPGPRLAALLEQRPDDLAPAPGAGTVLYPDPVTGEPPDPDTGDGDRRSGSPGGGGAGGFVGVVLPGRAVPARAGWANTVLDTIVARQRLISHLQARQYADIAELSAGYPGIHQYLSTELAAALHTTDAEGAALLGAAEALRDRLPETLTALTKGRIDDAKAMAIVRATTTSTRDVAAKVENAVLPHAERATPTTVRRHAGRAVIAADPDGAADRHRKARTQRHLWRAPDEDGMARLGIYAPAQDIATIWQTATTIADAIAAPGDHRPLGARRVDALVMICTDILNAGGWTGLRLPDKGRGKPHVNITVPYTVLLGHRAPCDLAGHGSITTEQALPLIGAGDLYRMLCDPVTGQLLDYGHTRYRPPPHLAAFVRARDGQCPAPTCHHPADRGHIDHIEPAKTHPATGKPTHGITAADNLAPPCPHHHNGKDAGRGYTLHRATDGTYTWTTPLGRTYTWKPDPLWHPDTDKPPDGLARALAAAQGNNDDEVPVCDCPDTCPCQHGPTNPDHHAPPLLTVDGDWADGYNTTERGDPWLPGRADDPIRPTTNTPEPATTPDAATDHPAIADPDPPPF